MTAKQQYLAVDLGAESGRVISAEFDGAKVTLNELHRFSNGPVKPGVVLPEHRALFSRSH